MMPGDQGVIQNHRVIGVASNRNDWITQFDRLDLRHGGMSSVGANKTGWHELGVILARKLLYLSLIKQVLTLVRRITVGLEVGFRQPGLQGLGIYAECFGCIMYGI